MVARTRGRAAVFEARPPRVAPFVDLTATSPRPRPRPRAAAGLAGARADAGSSRLPPPPPIDHSVETQGGVLQVQGHLHHQPRELESHE